MGHLSYAVEGHIDERLATMDGGGESQREAQRVHGQKGTLPRHPRGALVMSSFVWSCEAMSVSKAKVRR